MITKINKINALQLYSLLFIIRIFYLLTYSTFYGYTEDIRLALFSPLINFLVGYILFLPSYFIKNIEFNKFYNFIYGIIFFFCILKTLFVFMRLYEYVSYNQGGIITILFFLMLCASFCASHGIQGISRSSVIISVVIGIITVFFFFGIKNEFSIYNFLYVKGLSNNEVKNIFVMLSNNLEFCALPFLIKMVDRKKFLGFSAWSFLIMIVSTAVIYVCGMSLGLFGAKCEYPIYDAFSISKISILKRFDSLFIIATVFSCICLLSVFLSLFGKCVINISGKGRKTACYVCGICAFLSAVIFSNVNYFGKNFMNVFMWCLIIIFAAVVIPVLSIFKIKPKALVALFTALIIPMNFCSCSGQREINERLIITAIGIDYDNNEFSLLMKALNTDEASENKPLVNISAKDKSLSSAISAISLQTGKEPYFGQCLFLLISENAIDKKFDEVLDVFKKDFYSDGNIDIFSTSGTANEIMNFNGGINPEQIDAVSQNESFGSFSCDLVKAYNDYYSESSSLIIPSIEINDVSDGVIQQGGTLVKSDGVCGHFDKDKMIAYGILIGQKIERISFEGGYIKVKDNKSEIKFNSAEELEVSFLITVESDKKLEREYLELLKKRCMDTIEYALGNRCDIFNIGKTLYTDNNDLYNSIENPLEKIYKAKINLNINFEENDFK